MKRIILWSLFVLVMTFGMAMHGETPGASETTAPQDSTVNIIAWFNKHDTVTYRTSQNSWKLNGTDTVLTGSSSITARINVVDSTAEGYKMEYTFLDFSTDALPDSASIVSRFQNQITDKLARKIIGTTVRFETDEFGHITKFNNLGQVKKQSGSLFKMALDELSKMPEVQGLKDMGFDIKNYAKNIDTDKLVDGYLEELNMLFAYHGLSMEAGENTEHEDATASQYENTTYISAAVDADDDSYIIEQDVISILPRTELKKIAGGIAESFSNDSISNSINENFNSQINTDGTYRDYLKIGYLVNGWPYSVVRQKATMIGNRGRVKQTVISIDSYSFAQ